MAVARRGHPQNEGIVSDRGCHSHSRKFTQSLERHGLISSRGRAGSGGADDTAMRLSSSLLQVGRPGPRRWATTRQELAAGDRAQVGREIAANASNVGL